MTLFKRKQHDALDWPAYMARRAAESGDRRLRQFYAAGCPDPDAPVGQVPLVAMDMETTGLDERRHAIVSIGTVPFTTRRILFSRRYHQVLRPPRPLESTSVTFHGITHAEVARAPDLSEVLEDVLNQLAGAVVVVHYRGIERAFLHAAVRARLGEDCLFPVIDTMMLEARLHRSSLRARLRDFAGLSPASIRLNDSRARYGLPDYSAHHALTDALATAELLQAQLAYHYSPETPLRALWC